MHDENQKLNQRQVVPGTFQQEFEKSPHLKDFSQPLDFGSCLSLLDLLGGTRA